MNANMTGWLRGAQAGYKAWRNAEVPLARAMALAYRVSCTSNGERSTEQRFVWFKSGFLAMVCRKREAVKA